MNVINDGEKLYRYLKPEALPEGQNKIPSGLFLDKNLSCDWEKYQKEPENSIHVQQGKSLILEIKICDDIRNPKNPKNGNNVENTWKQEIIHEPLQHEQGNIFTPNESHSLIRGKKKPAVVDAIVNNSTFYK